MKTDIQVIDLREEMEHHVHQAAQILWDSFRVDWPNAWPMYEDAHAEVLDSLDEGRISRIAINQHDEVLGWIGAMNQNDGFLWELHPIVVHPKHRHEGIGRILVEDLVVNLQKEGASTLYLGTDDENDMTTLGGVDLFPNPLEHLAKLRDIKGHPFRFYEKLGFSVVGVLPDANGFGKPDILMARRISGR